MSAPRRWLRFAAGGLEVAAPAAAFRRALPAPSPLPERLEVEGESLPVVDLSALAGTDPAPPPPALLLVLADGAGRVVVPASEVSATVEAGPAEVLPLPWTHDGGEHAWCAGLLVPAGEVARAALALDLGGLARSAGRGPSRGRSRARPSAGTAAAVPAGEAAP